MTNRNKNLVSAKQYKANQDKKAARQKAQVQLLLALLAVVIVVIVFAP